jgi:hypothetical protein
MSIRSRLKQEVLASRLWGKVNKDFPYKTPKGFTRWDEILAVITSFGLVFPRMTQKLNTTCASSCLSWLAQQSPVYIARSDLIDQLNRTDITKKGVFAGIDLGIRQSLFLFPTTKIKTPSDGYLDWAIVTYLERGDETRLAYADCFMDGHGWEDLDENAVGQFRWFSMTDRGMDFVSTKIILQDGSLSEVPESKFIGISLTDEDKTFINQMTNLLIQCLILPNFEPDLVVDRVTPASKGFQQPSTQKGDKYWYPRELKCPEELKVRYKSEPKGGTHASPRSHWRRGHWRNQPCGEKSSERKIVWIKPVLVK